MRYFLVDFVIFFPAFLIKYYHTLNQTQGLFEETLLGLLRLRSVRNPVPVPIAAAVGPLSRWEVSVAMQLAVLVPLAFTIGPFNRWLIPGAMQLAVLVPLAVVATGGLNSWEVSGAVLLACPGTIRDCHRPTQQLACLQRGAACRTCTTRGHHGRAQ